VERLIQIVALTACLFATPIARADGTPPDEALQHWERGLELYDEQDFPNALIEFRKAYSIAPSYKVLYNIGQVCFQLKDYGCALTSFQRYLKDGGNNIASDRRKEVEKDLEKLKTRVGSIEVVTNVPGADVLVDEVLVGKAPLPASVIVTAGRRKITVTKDGVGTATRIVDVASTDSIRVEVNLETPKSAPPPPLPVMVMPSKWTTWSYVGLGAAGALAVAGGVTGVLALRASSDLEEERFVGSAPSSSFDAKSDRVRNLGIATDVLFAGAAVTLGTTLVLTLARTPKPEPAPASISLGVTPGGMVLQGAF
jgi:hypothetical protein